MRVQLLLGQLQGPHHRAGSGSEWSVSAEHAIQQPCLPNLANTTTSIRPSFEPETQAYTHLLDEAAAHDGPGVAHAVAIVRGAVKQVADGSGQRLPPSAGHTCSLTCPPFTECGSATRSLTPGFRTSSTQTSILLLPKMYMRWTNEVYHCGGVKLGLIRHPWGTHQGMKAFSSS